MNLEYSIYNGEPIIHFWVRENGERKHKIVRGFQPYFYVLESDIVPKDRRIVKTETGYYSIIGEPLRKIVAKLPGDVRELREMFTKSFESDIIFTQRWAIDTEPDFGEEIRVLFVDIECDDRTGFPIPEKAEKEIISLTMFDDATKTYYSMLTRRGKSTKNDERRYYRSRVDSHEYPWKIYYYATETDMLNSFIDLVRYINPDILSGWNCYRFDFEYIINRMSNLQINYNKLSPIDRVKLSFIRPGLLNPREKYRNPLDIGGRTIVDALAMYKKIERKGIESYSLGDVGKHEFGIDKVKFDGKIADLSLDELLNYNIGDVDLCYQIDKKRAAIAYFWGMANFIKCPITWTDSFSRMADTYILRKKPKGMAFPSVQTTPADTFEGAEVFDPPKGMFKDIVVFDLTSLYPSIIMSANISPECACKKEDADIIVEATQMYSKKEPRGFIPRVMDGLFEERQKYLNLMNQQERGTHLWKMYWSKNEYIKQMANSVYGLFAYKGFRLYVPKLSETTTYMGRETLKWTKKVVEEDGYKVIYGDTDSLFIQGFNGTTEEILEKASVLQTKINKSYDEFVKQFGMDKHRLSIKFEEIYDRVVFTGTKKRYFGHMTFKRGKVVDLFDVVGFELRRSDTSKFTKSFQKELMLMCLDGKGRSEIDKFIRFKVEEVRSSGADNIAIPKGIIMDMSKYKVETNVIKGAKYANQYMGKNYDSGDKVKIVYVKRCPKELPQYLNGVKLDCVAFDDASDIKGFEIDYERMTDLLILKKVEPIYDAMGFGQFILDNSQKTLGDF